MGGKRTGETPAIRPRGPQVAGPLTGAAAAGPPILARIIGPQVAQNNAAFEKSRETASGIVGTVASIISNIFYPGSGAITGPLANMTLRQQYNTFGGRPFMESSDEPWKDWASILGSGIGGYAGGAAGGAVGGAVGGTAGASAGSSVGSLAGRIGGGYAGGLVRQAVHGPARSTPYWQNPYVRYALYR